MSTILYINEVRVAELLNWSSTYEAVEASMKAVSKANADQKARLATQVKNSGPVLYSMPAYLDDPRFGALACKLVTVASNNEKRSPPVPNVNANIALLNETTGELKAIIAATEITGWRTAAASAVATKYICGGKGQTRLTTLAILGSGVQGRAHAQCFHELFDFEEIRMWNHTKTKAEALAVQLKTTHGINLKLFDTAEECVMGADVIITATSSPTPILRHQWLKNDVHINAVGVVTASQFAELEKGIYQNADTFVDSLESAHKELEELEKIVQFKGEVGQLINGTISAGSSQNRITVFQSLGMAVEDCAMARMIFDMDNKSK